MSDKLAELFAKYPVLQVSSGVCSEICQKVAAGKERFSIENGSDGRFELVDRERGDWSLVSTGWEGAMLVAVILNLMSYPRIEQFELLADIGGIDAETQSLLSVQLEILGRYLLENPDDVGVRMLHENFGLVLQDGSKACV